LAPCGMLMSGLSSRAAEMLMELLGGGTSQREAIPPALVERRSVADRNRP
jgi:DNA-binding LacI/PurR family transcriptional regulator